MVLALQSTSTAQDILDQDGYTSTVNLSQCDDTADMDRIIAKLCKECNKKGIEELINNGFSIDTPLDDNNTMLHIASYYGCRKIVDMLINLGADVNGKNTKGQTPLHLAAYSKWPKTSLLLIENGANPSLRTNKGRTPADLAEKQGAIVLAERLRSEERNHGHVATNHNADYNRSYNKSYNDSYNKQYSSNYDVKPEPQKTIKNEEHYQQASYENNGQVLRGRIERSEYVTNPNMVVNFDRTSGRRIECAYNTDYLKRITNAIDPSNFNFSGDITRDVTDFLVNTAVNTFKGSDSERDFLYCKHSSNEQFKADLANRNLIPMYLYSGAVTKFFVEKYPREISFDDANESFVFQEPAADSPAKYFGFYNIVDNSFTIWSLDRGNSQIYKLPPHKYPEILPYLQTNGTETTNDKLKFVSN